jgi:nucleotide-binding universal stress UspA family protein
MKILVGYDGTDLAKKALKLAQEHAKRFDAKIYVLHSKVTDLPKKEHVLDKQDMENVRNLLKKEGFPCETHLSICNMTPAEHLVLFAEQNEIDEIIIGVKMKSRVGKFILGSTAQHVILGAPCPVVSVK